ncbi:hypothetical protein LDL08_19950 [Nonomuraea glycinis]|uniref:Uncharacterized protein n=1 Tax=Nonomuraea glycinis TaxID=2047744 RepID=A0A918E853_9ACTN|nr:hypothetical protein [Nonomuraea glycinis]MCA2178466.1 hypothetical protein [Nonomuraea glycinis]GGP14160.1 hypothetical protein GCM10012278_68840 [Nonomuraea glycinis]
MDPIVLTAGTALVTAMATDAWQAARDGAVALWRKARPEQADAVEAELVEVREQVLVEARKDSDTEQAMAGAWQVRLQQLLRAEPGLAGEIKRVLDEVLTPALEPAEQGAHRFAGDEGDRQRARPGLSGWSGPDHQREMNE